MGCGVGGERRAGTEADRQTIPPAVIEASEAIGLGLGQYGFSRR